MLIALLVHIGPALPGTSLAEYSANAEFVFDLRDMMQADLFKGVTFPTAPFASILHVAPEMLILAACWLNKL